MNREIIATLNHWYTSAIRMPLLIRGARQVGKTYAIETFAQQTFSNVIRINFELEPHFIACFDTLEPQTILNAILALTARTMKPNETLLFLDEIQICPRAIMALRYFKEKMPELPVIAAGSLVEFALNDENFSMPVGRVQSMHMKPLSFCEYLRARDHEVLLHHLEETSLDKPLHPAIHMRLLELVNEYSFIGGMPAAVKTFIETKNYENVQQIQTGLLSTFRNDFGKYAKLATHKYLQSLFDKTPSLIGEQIKFSKIDPNFRARELSIAVENLKRAGIIHTVYATTAAGLPLKALIQEKKFKLLFLDIGLVSRAMRLTFNHLQQEDFYLINQGAMTEQWVGQELIAYSNLHEEPELYFWNRDKPGSQAEVDYVMVINNHIVPIEVKSGKTGRLKSLQIMMQEKNLPLGVKISKAPLSYEKGVLSVPFYLVNQLPRLVMESL